jgi:DNA topoisomerase-1
MVVSGWLEENFPKYVSDTFTAEMEDELDEIARGEREYTETLSAFYKPFEKAVLAKNKLPKATSLGDAPAEFPCPICGKPMEFKLGRGGVFMSCKDYPKCLGARTEDGAELKNDEPIGNHPETGAPIFIKTGRFGPYVEMPTGEGEEVPSKKDPASPKATQGGRKRGRPRIVAKRASIPKGTDISQITLADAVKYLSLPRELGNHPSTGKPVFASTGRFGPYVGSDGEFRSIKNNDPYKITLDEALALLSEPKKQSKGVEIVKEIGAHPRTGKLLTLYKSKQGLFLKKGLRRIYLPSSVSADSLTPAEAAEYLK